MAPTFSPHNLPAHPERACCGGWCTSWGATEEQKPYWPPRHSDYRDRAPEQMEKVYQLYDPVVKENRWTEGLCEMWFWKNKAVKHSVHIPCWDSFKWNPLKWRGYCFGRTVDECMWTGTRQMRWARAVYAANLGREYVMPVKDIGKHGYKSDIKALCCMYFLMSTIFSCGIGQVFSLCGSCLFMNFGAWYSCHARERLRRRYGLPSMFGLPPGIDDCLVHFFCFYCASHQELRELAVRGVDGPGMHILDVLPESFKDAPGIDKALEERKAKLESMLSRPPKMFRARGLKRQETNLQMRVAAAAVAMAGDEVEEDGGEINDAELDRGASTLTSAASMESNLGWARYAPPGLQEMERGGSIASSTVLEAFDKKPVGGEELQDSGRPAAAASKQIPVIDEAAREEAKRKLQRAWTIAY